MTFGKPEHEDSTGEEFSLRDDDAMANCFISLEMFSNLGAILELNNHFQGSY